MSAGTLTGLTWDHPRGYGPLEALNCHDRAAGHPTATPIQWHRQPLEGFESTPLAQLADDYDLLVIDHPHVADAVNAETLIALNDLVPADTLARWRDDTAGPSFDSYVYRERCWAIPVDAATQVMATRRDVPALETWQDVLEYAQTQRVILCLAGPHAFLTWTAILVSMGAEPAGDQTYAHDLAGEGSRFVDRSAGLAALDLLSRLHKSAAAGFLQHNPIAALEAMATDTSIRLCPLVYGYVNYSRPRASNHPPINFRDAPSWTPNGRRGSVLGGTGVAVTNRAWDRARQIVPHLMRLMDAATQRSLIPDNGGQPSARAAWKSARVNTAAGGFYRGTSRTLEDAWVRPRVPGWSPFQDTASNVIRAVLADSTSQSDALDAIDLAYLQLRSPKGA